MALRLLMSVALVGSLGCAAAQTQGGASTLSKIPGGQTAAAALASSTDGLSRYFAPDGPIQPGITAAMGLPMRAGEYVNQGITRLSSGLNSGAQSLSRAAGQAGSIRMPGMEALESSMPASLASLGESMHNMIRGKNNFIRGQAEAGIAAGNRLANMMRSGLQVRSAGPADMMSSAQDFMSKSASTLQSQLKQHMEGTMSRMGSMQSMGEGVRGQLHTIGQTMSSGVQGAVGQLQQTGQQVLGQLQGNHHKNMQGVSGILGSLQNSMGTMGGNMQKNLDGLMRHAQSTGQQLSSSLQQAAQVPMQLVSSIGGMMKGAGGSAQKGARY